MITFGEQLASARKAKGMTQDQLATEMNITRQGVSRWENGRSLPDAETLKRLSQVLEYNFVSDEPILHTHEEPAPANVPAQDEPAETAEVEEKTAEPAQISRKQSLIRCALCLALGLVVGCLMGIYLFPHPAQPDTSMPAEGIFPPKSAESTYHPEVEGQAYLTFTSAENPVKAIRTSGDGAAWIYTITVKNVGDTTFSAQEFSQAMLNDAGEVAGVQHYSAADMGWGEGVVLPGCTIQFNGGFPVQQASAVRFTIKGVDANGVEMTFEGDIPLSYEIVE